MKKIFILVLLSFNALAIDGQRTILFLGDSNPARYAHRMHRLLSDELAASVHFYALPGATPRHYSRGGKSFYQGAEVISNSLSAREHRGLMRRMRSPSIETLISSTRPDVYIIALGGNLIPSDQRRFYTRNNHLNLSLGAVERGIGPDRAKKLTVKVSSHVKELLSHIPDDADCLWIGPPFGAVTHLKPTFFFDALERAVEKDDRCQYMDGRVLWFQGAGRDPVHYSHSEAQVLADRLFYSEMGIFDRLR